MKGEIQATHRYYRYLILHTMVKLNEVAVCPQRYNFVPAGFSVLPLAFLASFLSFTVERIVGLV